ncbi:18149_t:CDS:2 [Funneliformis geosporum]|uniref:15743_t:CDS:1 n=1 Tax=Funneliformis geosporum TaxID=1117311 RepID=A0A9W4SZW6_9GLOM|nr:15743_t:CDS:2 [Funneliformis geosporum]CAI2185530.1 18149_t:CDS:2 [Funneliformis geosporum]
MENILLEIFNEICKYVSPKDLYSLSTVCKRYRKILWSTHSIKCQNIWKASRQRCLTYPNLPPPNGWNEDWPEQKYIWFTLLNDKCFICKDHLLEIFHDRCWEFRVNCCKDCFNKCTVSHDNTKINIPQVIYTCVPWIRRRLRRGQPIQYFWVKDIQKAYDEYKGLVNEMERQDWIVKKQRKVQRFLQEIFDYKLQDTVEITRALQARLISNNHHQRT